MKKLLAILASVFVFSSAQAQEKKIMLPMTCTSIEFVEQVLKKYKEEQLFIGQDNTHDVPDLNIMVFLNKKTGSYSLLLMAANTNMICIVSSGEKGRLLYKD